MIDVDNVSVAIAGKPIVNAVTFTAAAGALTVIIGPNGSGKTTLIKALSGDLPYTGAVRINGRNCRDMKPWQMAALRAVLPQATTLAFPFTVREIVGLGLTGGRPGGVDAGGDPVEAALERVDLAGFGGRFYQELSGGEQQRVQLARVLCQVWQPVLDGAPRWLLLDEPVSSLDIKHQLVIMEIAADFARSGGGVVAILHDLNLSAMFADQLIVMSRGKIDSAGPPRAIIDAPLLQRVFDCRLQPGALPASGTPFVLPHSVRP